MTDKASARSKSNKLTRSRAPAATGRLDAPPESAKVKFPIVGVGASAGGLEAYTQLLQRLSTNTGMAFVLVQHLDPDHASALTQILSKATSLPIQEATDDLAVEPNHVYVIPPNTSMSIARGVLKLQMRELTRGRHTPIDSFFESLAEDQREQAIGVVLSGTANDGTLGLEAVRAEGGITFAQDESAKYDSMPRSAIAAGCVDFVLKPADIAKELGRIAKHPLVAGRPAEPSASPEDDRASATAHEDDETPLPSGGHGKPLTKARQAHVEGEATHAKSGDNGYKKILLLLRNHCGVDFSLYKSTTIQRRIGRRMVLNKQDTLEEYAHFLRGNGKELDALYSDVLISVTSFFRNPEAFEILKRKVFPRLLQQRGEKPLRVWVLGCSTGQEAYSIAMAFVETAESATRTRKLQIFATDLNNALLDKARHGLYAKSLVQDISPERLRRFFVEEEGGYRVSKQLREMVVFARQNLIADPPFSRLDLVSCRNLLIYLEPSLQKKLLPTFHYALKPEGFLFLGASESVGGFTDLFAPADKRHKIYTRKAAATQPLQLPVRGVRGEYASPAQANAVNGPFAASQGQGAPEGFAGEFNSQREADRIAANKYAPPGVLVNADLQVLQFRGPTTDYFELPTGKASFDILKLARDGLMLPLRTAINKAKKENKTVRTENVAMKLNGATRRVNLEVIPLKNLRERCFLVLFDDAQKAARAGRGEQSHHEPTVAVGKSKAASRSGETRRVAELERENVELRDYLQSIQEQHDAVNEELQASSEELQSANEELQSINEELETSKEELESANEELTTVNDEMSNRNIELNRLNSDLVNLQTSIHQAIVLVGRDLTIRRFSPQAERQFNLLAVDIGRPISGLRHGLDLTDLEDLITKVIDTIREVEREVRDKQGRWYSLRLRPYITLDNKVDGAVIILVDIDALKRSGQDAAEAREQAEAVIHTVPDPLLILDGGLRVSAANDAFYRAFKTVKAETEGRSLFELDDGAWKLPHLRQLLENIIPRNSFFNDLEVKPNFKQGGVRTFLLNARTLETSDTRPKQILIGMRDITEVLAFQVEMRHSELRFRRLFEEARDGVLLLDPATEKIVDANPFMTELLGYTREQLRGKELFEIGLPKDRIASKDAIRQLKKQGHIRYEDLPLETSTGVRRRVEFVSNLYIENGREIIQCNIRDISDRKKTEEELARRARLLDLSHDAIIVRDAGDHRITYWNRGAEELYGWSREEAVGQVQHALLHSEFPKPFDQIIAELHRDNRWTGELVQTKRDGNAITVQSRWVLDHDESGNPTSVLSTNTDITERKRSDQHRALLMAECDHRVKNTLTTVQSIARHTSVHATSIDDFRDAFDARLMALAQTHNLLTLGQWRSASLRNIVVAEMSPYNDDKSQRAVIAGEDVKLNSSQALIIGLAVHELATNAAKYGALSVPEGRVDISWDISADADGPVVQFRWIETGGPAVEQPRRRGFGTRLIERALKHDLEAEQVDLDFHPDGVRFSLQFHPGPEGPDMIDR